MPSPARPAGASRRSSVSEKCCDQMRIAAVTAPSSGTCTMSHIGCDTNRWIVTATTVSTIHASTTALVSRYQLRRDTTAAPLRCAGDARGAGGAAGPQRDDNDRHAEPEDRDGGADATRLQPEGQSPRVADDDAHEQ